MIAFQFFRRLNNFVLVNDRLVLTVIVGTKHEKVRTRSFSKFFIHGKRKRLVQDKNSLLCKMKNVNKYALQLNINELKLS